MKSKALKVVFAVITLTAITFLQSCYSLSGISTTASSIQIDNFFNNTDLGPANLGADFTNRLKDYMQRNSSLRVVSENGELALEGVITDYRLSPIAPQSSPSQNLPDQAARTRLTIVMKVNYVDNLVPENSFKDKSFSFYDDFDNTEDLLSVQDRLHQRIFEQIMLDIFNATLATW